MKPGDNVLYRFSAETALRLLLCNGAIVNPKRHRKKKVFQREPNNVNVYRSVSGIEPEIAGRFGAPIHRFWLRHSSARCLLLEFFLALEPA